MHPLAVRFSLIVVLLNIGFKSDGIVSRNNLVLEIGDIVRFLLKNEFKRSVEVFQRGQVRKRGGER
jgi:hypothetical protein